jgi:hypothetical protein
LEQNDLSAAVPDCPGSEAIVKMTPETGRQKSRIEPRYSGPDGKL